MAVHCKPWAKATARAPCKHTRTMNAKWRSIPNVTIAHLGLRLQMRPEPKRKLSAGTGTPWECNRKKSKNIAPTAGCLHKHNARSKNRSGSVQVLWPPPSGGWGLDSTRPWVQSARVGSHSKGRGWVSTSLRVFPPTVGAWIQQAFVFSPRGLGHTPRVGVGIQQAFGFSPSALASSLGWLGPGFNKPLGSVRVGWVALHGPGGPGLDSTSLCVQSVRVGPRSKGWGRDSTSFRVQSKCFGFLPRAVGPWIQQALGFSPRGLGHTPRAGAGVQQAFGFNPNASAPSFQRLRAGFNKPLGSVRAGWATLQWPGPGSNKLSGSVQILWLFPPTVGGWIQQAFGLSSRRLRPNPHGLSPKAG